MSASGSGPRPGGTPRRGLEPTRPINLVVAAAVSAVAAFVFIRQYFGDIPDLTWFGGLTMAGLAAVEAVAARNTRARIERRPRAGVLNPLLVARLAVLAKASSLAGAIFAGAYAGVAAWALSERARLGVAERTFAPALVGVIGALALVAAALFLEWSCRVPKQPDEDEDNPERP